MLIHTVDGFHISFPDPWHKKRQQKRRLIQSGFAKLLSQKLTQGGYIYLVTDWEEYAQQMLDVLNNEDTLVNPFDDFCEPVEWRPTTSFEKKGIQKEHGIYEIWFEKK